MSLDPNDPAYLMSVPSEDPYDVLGYTQRHQDVLTSPLARLGYSPQYDVYVPPKYDKRNLGPEKSTYWGATLPEGYTWQKIRNKFPDEDVARTMVEYINTLPQGEREMLSKSDQTAYFNKASQQRGLSTTKHESAHRAIVQLASKYWGARINAKDNEMIATLADWKHGNAEQKAYSRQRMGWISGIVDGEKVKELSDADFDRLRYEYSPLLEELEAYAIQDQPTAFQKPQPSLQMRSKKF